MYRRTIRLDDADEVADVVARRLLDRIVELQDTSAQVHICLTGGETANQMYERFAALVPDSALDATKLQLWWGDERFVPATDADRNSLQAVSRLARTVSIKSADIHMMPAQDGRADSHQCAVEYEAELGDTVFDITLLGIGADGHVGSIFPDHPSFEPTNRQVIGVTDSPKPPSERISLTIPTINRSEEIWIIATGASKADAVARALEGDAALPASHVQAREATYWFLDADAAAQLPEPYNCAL
ncbi:6-phosphogluconolactonase [Tessaracoccus antarcticus]|uniref:6-phosphogluconolactonase n=1 Tax=Tessaracoccus antarcticus TaxID=2479848 RepID=A0A3M0G418_9ACTN|nr:6-phosphogluconolactonase [Tessaracoccus antarcticus]RMB59721.1 6-phosphogluconolactonase [Tessaracoccus antarcticus]